MESSSIPSRVEINTGEGVHLAKIPSLLRQIELPAVIHVSRDIPAVVEGAVIVVQVLSTVGKRTNIEDITEQGNHLEEGDIIPAVLGKRRMFNGFSCDIPHTLAAGDILYWSSGSGVVGEIRGSDPAWGQPLPVRVLGSAQVSGTPLNIKHASPIPRLMQLEVTTPVVCVVGTATNTGKTTTATKVVQHFKSKGQRVACAKLTGMALLAEMRKLSSSNADLVLGFMDAGLPSTCGEATEVVEVALGILHQLNQIQPDVIVVEFGASFLGLYNTEKILCSLEFKKHISAIIMSASDPVAAWGAKQIMDRWGIDITAFTGPVVNSKSFAAYVEDTLGILAEDNRGAMPNILSLVESKLDDFRQRQASATIHSKFSHATVPITEKLPDDPLFHHILKIFTTNPDHILLHDWVKGTEASYRQLMTDMLYMRREIFQAMPVSMFDTHRKILPERPFILVLAPGNYEFIVAAFSILCSGAAFASLASTLSPEEVNYILEITNASCILVSPEFQHQASAIIDYQTTHKTNCSAFVTIPIVTGNGGSGCPKAEIQIDTEMVTDPLSPGALIFTSGTTGPPKCIVRPRKIFYTFPESFPDGRVALSFRPPTWSSAILPLIWRVLQGNRTEVTGSNACEMWERLRKGGVTDLKMAPHFWASLMRYFIEHIDELPSEEREQYVKAARDLKRPIISGDFGWSNVTKFWQELLGRPLIVYYGSTEAGNLTVMMNRSNPSLEGCIGQPQRGVRMKLSNGDHGEILAKSEMMFTSYLGNETATRDAFDKDGYFRTGDFARLVGDQYVLEGRLSTDFIRHYGLWVPLREVEARLAELPYISEAYIVPVVLNLNRQIAAVVHLKAPNTPVSLLQLREDLQSKLSKYKLPTLLRILEDGEQVPQTVAGKVSRRDIAEKYFASSGDSSLPLEVEFYDGRSEVNGPRKAWDWAGMI